jgi:sulfur-oxidizing protein SoxZ
MTNKVQTRLAFLGEIKPGAHIEARWSAAHPMDSGFRVDDSGRRIARNIINQVHVYLNDQLLLEADLGTAMTSPVYLSFPLQVPATGGVVKVVWKDDIGQIGETLQRLML